MLSTVVFDADETLLDLRPAMTGGLLAVLDEMRRLAPVPAEVSLRRVESGSTAMVEPVRRGCGQTRSCPL